MQQSRDEQPLVIAGRTMHSRLMVGTGKYASFEQTKSAIEASDAAAVTMAIRRVNLGQKSDEPNLLEYMPKQVQLLPNTAGCYSAKDAVRTAMLARELLDGETFIKLEVLGDETTLYPNVPETVAAAKTLVAEGFDVLVYTSDDPIQAQQLQDIGCVAIMPLAAPIGSGLGVCNPHTINIILRNATVPVIVDAGVGTASDACIAMELGCDGILMNTAIANAQDPVRMAHAMRMAVSAGRDAFLAGRMEKLSYGGRASSPTTGIVQTSNA